MLKDLENFKGITVVERKENDKGKSYGEGWHTDSSYLDKTPKYTCLMGKIVRKDQGQTLFASQMASYEALDIAEDRGRFSELLKENNIPYPKFAVAETAEAAGVRLPSSMQKDQEAEETKVDQNQNDNGESE